MSKTVAFIAQTPGSATIEDQQASFDPNDIRVFAGRRNLSRLESFLDVKGIRLGQGDRVRVHDLSCLNIATPMLIRAVLRLLRSGVSFEIANPRIIIEPKGEDKAYVILEALDIHYRHLHGIKTHPPKMAQAGRKRLLNPDELPEILAKLNAPGATQAGVAQALGVSRSTLFNFLAEFDVEGRQTRSRRRPVADVE